MAQDQAEAQATIAQYLGKAYITEDMAYVERMIHETRTVPELKRIARQMMAPQPTVNTQWFASEAERDAAFPTKTKPFPAQALGTHAQDTGLKTKGW